MIFRKIASLMLPFVKKSPEMPQLQKPRLKCCQKFMKKIIEKIIV